MVKVEKGQTREEKVENLIKNHTMIFMALFEDAFAAIAEKMTAVMAAAGSAMAEAMGGKSTGTDDSGPAQVGKKIEEELTPGLKAEIEHAFSGIRGEIASQWPKDTSSFKEYIADPTFDKAIEVVERHDFHLPKLTESMTDEDLASYVLLLKSGDGDLSAMLKELADLMSALPRPPWASRD